MEKERMMAEDVYERLREHLDSLPVGYPRARSGVELRVLKKLFTEEEAETACHLKPFPETPDQVASRLGRDPKVVSDLLCRMSRKGLIFRAKSGGLYQYMAIMFVVGTPIELMGKELEMPGDSRGPEGNSYCLQS
jgi:electron transport complex protein RnfB